MRNWAVSLTFRGFDQSLELVQQVLGNNDCKIGMRGDPVKLGAKARLAKSYVKYNFEFKCQPNIFEIVPKIISHAGGLDYLFTLKEKIAPEHIELNIVMPIKNSLEQEGGFISPESIADINRLGASLTFEFLEANNG
jgi:hypothetical protein